MNRVDAMSGLISHRLSKTATHAPIRAMVRGVPIYISGDQQGAAGILDTGFLANIREGIEQTNADVETLRNEVYTAAQFGGPTSDRNVQAIREYYTDVVVPFLKDWNKFVSNHSHGWGKFKDNFVILGGLSSWNSLNQYRQRILDIRKAAEGFINFKAPAPAGPSVNMVGKAYDKVESATQEIWKVVKWVVIIAVVAIGLSFAIYGLPNLTVTPVPVP